MPVAREISQASRQPELTASADITDNHVESMHGLPQTEDTAALIQRAETDIAGLDHFERWRVAR